MYIMIRYEWYIFDFVYTKLLKTDAEEKSLIFTYHGYKLSILSLKYFDIL